MNKYDVLRHDCSNDSFNSHVVVEAETPKQAAEKVNGFDKEDGDMTAYDYEVTLLNGFYEPVKKCGSYSFESQGDYYSLEGFEGTLYFQGVVNEDGTVLQGFVIAVYGPFFPDEQAYEDGQDIAPVLNSKAQTFPVSRFVDNGKFHKMTAKEIFNEL